MTPEDLALCIGCGHRGIEHDAIRTRPCRKAHCKCRRYLEPEPDVPLGSEVRKYVRPDSRVDEQAGHGSDPHTPNSADYISMRERAEQGQP